MTRQLPGIARDVIQVTDRKMDRVQIKSQTTKRPLGASDELFFERRERAADAARRGFGHYGVLFCSTAGVVVFQPRGLWSTLGSLSTDHPIDIGGPPNQQAFSIPPVA